MRSTIPQKIAIYLPSLVGGGAERVMINLAAGLLKHGMLVDLVLAEAKGEYLSILPHGIRVIDLGARRVLTSIPGLVRYLRREQPVAMLSAMDHANIVALWAARLARKKTRIVVSVHVALSAVLDRETVQGRLWLMLMRRFYPWASSVIVVSKDAREDFIRLTKLDSQIVKVIYNPVLTSELFTKAKEIPDHPWFKPGSPPVILGVGRLTRQKDFATLIRAFKRVHQQCPSRLVIIGEGEERSNLKELVDELDIGNDVDIPGFVENPYAYMSHAAVFVLSSLFEGLPTVLIEALAVGVPVISTDCRSGPREILNSGEYGILVPVGDEAAIAYAVLRYFEGRPACIDLKKATVKYELDNVTNSYVQVLLGGEFA